jgi:diguanylate cyclase (GGDEF)-like protein/PAS domain S-box-containing protein
LADALELLRQRDRDLQRAGLQLSQARQDLEDTNRGLIALYTELQESRQAEARLAAVVQSSDDAIISMSPDGLIETWNPGADRLLGHRERDIVDQPVHIVMPLESRELFTEAIRQIRADGHTEPYNTQWLCADGVLVDVAVNVFALRDGDGELLGFSAIARDITAQIQVQRQLEKLARFDVLTGLVNRAETLARLQAALDNPRVPGGRLGVLFCDVDHFKTINDTWGHAVGDLVLTTMARRLRDCVRAGDTVGRLGGDEMLVLLPHLHNLDEAVQIAEKVRLSAAQAIPHNGTSIHATLSIGATLAMPGELVSTMTARADVAMYEAKRGGRNMVTRIGA